MSIFNLLTLLGGLSMFLYGMRLMGDNLKESSSGSLKVAMEKMTNTPVKAFFMGVAVTAVIQSSTATIVITSGLVGAGIISLHQSLGIVIGANVGTTVTGQIIRLLDISADSASWLQIFKPSTLAPVALIIGIILIMGFKFKNSKTAGGIAMGFGILFTGLLTMTGAVSDLSDSGIFVTAFSRLGGNPLIGYITGAGVAFILQSSSATIGILQAFSLTGQLTFSAIYSVLVGIYLGDCVTTAIVCSIGAKPDAKRVGIVNILFNLSETLVVLIAVTVIHKLGIIDHLWSAPLTSGGIANTNTVFNLGCAILLFPMIPFYEKLSRVIVKDEPVSTNKYSEKLNALNPVFFKTPALAFSSSYDILTAMFEASRTMFDKAMSMLSDYDESVFDEIESEEENVDLMADKLSNYLVQFSPHINQKEHLSIMDQYLKVTTKFERLGDYAINIAECAQKLHRENARFSDESLSELKVLYTLLDSVYENTKLAFERRDVDAARHIEPLEEVVDDIIDAMTESHMQRLRDGKCEQFVGNNLLNLLSDIERISDVCSDVGVATIARVYPDLASQAHMYISSLHKGSDERYNREYDEAYKKYFAMLENK